ncbi:MAG: hypothetical protein ABI624_19350 [Casimicrobiaceae bacterium]
MTFPAKFRRALVLEADDHLIAETTPEGLLLRPAVQLAGGLAAPAVQASSGATIARAEPVKITKTRKGGTSDEFSRAVGRALRRSARRAREVARMHGTPIYVLKDGKIVAIKP